MPGCVSGSGRPGCGTERPMGPMAAHIHIWDDRRRSTPRGSCYDSPYRGSVTDSSLSSYRPPLRRSARRDPPPRGDRDRDRRPPAPRRDEPPREDRGHGFLGAGSAPLAVRQRREPVSNDRLRAIRDALFDNKSLPAEVDLGPGYWNANRRLSLGASDRDVAWFRDAVWRAAEIWAERHRGSRVADSVPRQDSIMWPSTTPTNNQLISDFGNEQARLKTYQRQLRWNEGHRL
jgi:hypothetical protein